ncbi:unconventional myosin-XVI-like [Babylonia areolata]|uniref:unconventional myosin-XVI-like n=1 Tax=Babylonia areolata TaxID=304850 RepID=UPI003FD1D3D5
MDFAVQSLDGLGQAERIRLCRQMRRKQVENYLEFVARELASQPDPPRPLPRKPNSRGTVVHFHGDVCLQTAVEQTDEKEVLASLHGGSDCNFSTGNGTSLLHKCCAEGNFAMAELLVLKGADVNCADDDWWTPLHVACYQDNADIVQLLLTNGADVSAVDVDGNFPLDHAPQNTDTWENIISFMENKGLSENKLKKLRQQRCRQLEEDVKTLIKTSQDVNTVSSDDGVTLLHMAAANGYVKSGKLLLKHGADVNTMTYSSGWTPLHCAARFGQAKMVELLIKFGADTSAADKGGQRPIDLAAGEEIQKLILEARAAARKSSLVDVKDGPAGGGTDDEDDISTTKIVRPSHLPLSKADRLMEGQMLLQARALPPAPPPPPSSKPPARKARGKGVGRGRADDDDDDDSDEDKYEEIFATSIYSTAETEEGQLPPRTPEDDLSSLPSLTERIILDTVLQRYSDKNIYTYMGDVLIAVNPFTDLPVYGKWASKTYREAPSMTSLPPHVYAVAEHAQRVMRSSRTNQCCVISGESGAGKTETSKLLVQHLMCGASSSEHQLNSKLHQINPLLEAFGNAQTAMNNNSSRFAKYLELVFSPDGCVLGGHLHQYLLEKSRVVQQGPKEGNFHIFCWLLHGATPEERAHCMLDRTEYRYLQSAGTGTGGSSAQQKLLEVKDCMKFVGFSQDDITNMATTVAAVLHLGDVTFTQHADGQVCTPANPGILRKVCSLLRVPYDDLASALAEDVLTARGEELRKPLTPAQCRDNVHAVSKAVYSRLFAWIVNGINQMVAPLEDRAGEKLTIGILDIFGFENLHSNGFEQMCINVANERLQQYYQRQVFEEERQECLAEGVPPVPVDFPSSQQVIQLFMEKNTGVYDLLDEESTFPKASDETLATKLHYYLGKKHDNVYKTPRYGGTSFTVVHYAGAVQYSVDGIIEKNRDTLRNALAFVMRSSESLLVKELFQAALTKTGSISPSARQRVSRKMKPSKSPFDFFKKLRMSRQDSRGQKKKANVPSGTATSRKCPSTLTFHFKNSLREMLSQLELSAPHFIRCVKPNPSGVPLLADRDYTAAQLRYSGVLQTAVLRKEGYAVRSGFQHFVDSYPALALFYGGGGTGAADVGARAHNLMTSFDIPRAQAGHSKVFLRLKQADQLEEANARVTGQVITMQAVIRRYLAARLAEKRRRARAEYRRQLEVQRDMEEQEAERRRAMAEEEKRQAAKEEEEKRKREEGGEGSEEVEMRRPHPNQNLTGVPAEARGSLEFLDSVISEYTSGSPWQPDRSFDSADRSDDAFLTACHPPRQGMDPALSTMGNRLSPMQNSQIEGVEASALPRLFKVECQTKK